MVRSLEKKIVFNNLKNFAITIYYFADLISDFYGFHLISQIMRKLTVRSLRKKNVFLSEMINNSDLIPRVPFYIYTKLTIICDP